MSAENQLRRTLSERRQLKTTISTDNHLKPTSTEKYQHKLTPSTDNHLKPTLTAKYQPNQTPSTDNLLKSTLTTKYQHNLSPSTDNTIHTTISSPWTRQDLFTNKISPDDSLTRMGTAFLSNAITYAGNVDTRTSPTLVVTDTYISVSDLKQSNTLQMITGFASTPHTVSTPNVRTNSIIQKT